MSPALTFRQKLIRINGSAAICGLSISFILGEVVDTQALRLRQWAEDPSLLPANYLPVQPLLAAAGQISTTRWSDNLLALNNLPQLPAASDAGAGPTILAEQTIYMEPAVVMVAAAPARVPNVDLPPAQVEKVLNSIHEAEAKLSSHLTAVEPPLAKAEKAPKAPAHEWSIQGKIWGANSQVPGHFEVALYSKIDPDGKPVGYPMPQSILKAGQTTFQLDVPARVERGYLFAEFVPSKLGRRTWISPALNLWERSTQRMADLYFHAEDAVVSASAAPASIHESAHEQWRVQGNVGTMFASAPIPQGDVVIRVRGRKEATRTDAAGNFSLELPKLKGTLFLEVLKSGYHPSIVNVPAGDERPLKVEIASVHAMEQIAQRLGTSQMSGQGIYLGQAVGQDGTAIRGVSASMSLKADGPFFFDDEGNASRELKATGSNGRFLFLNVDTGTGYLEMTINGEAIAPIQVSSVDGGELTQKVLTPVAGTLRGRIFNPVAAGAKLQPLSGSRVRVDGASDWVSSDAYGAFSIGPLKWIKGEKIALEMSAEKFNNHRFLVSGEAEPINLFAFPAAYIAHLARSMDVEIDAGAGVVIGKVAGPSLRIDALADQASVNNAKDFYFDGKGRLRGSHEMTDPRFGNYIIFNVPKGRALLQGNDSAGLLRYSDAVYAGASSINVEME